MSIYGTRTLTIHCLRQDDTFATLWMDGGSDLVYEVGQLFDGTPITALPEITFSTYPGDPDLPVGDFIDCVPRLLLSPRAVEALEGILARHGQLFPVSTSAGEYFAYNVTTMVDALDREHSVLEMRPQLRREREAGLPRRVHHVKQHWFHADRLEGIDIFKLPEFPWTEVYVSDRFVRAAEQTLLTGFRFERLWSPADPMPDLRPRRLPG
ncbi:MAG: imm11 family protein [Planctomycetota bacterium]|jgi:hypothetical protein